VPSPFTPSSIPGSGTGSGSKLVSVTATDVTVSSSTEATPDDVISLGAFTYTAAATVLEFYAATADVPSGALGLILELWDANTYLARILDVRSGNATTPQCPLYARYELTPSAASHTYKIRGIKVGGLQNCTIRGGTGTGGSGTYTPIQLSARLA
jgi:hypothetical protein